MGGVHALRRAAPQRALPRHLRPDGAAGAERRARRRAGSGRHGRLPVRVHVPVPGRPEGRALPDARPPPADRVGRPGARRPDGRRGALHARAARPRRADALQRAPRRLAAGARPGRGGRLRAHPRALPQRRRLPREHVPDKPAGGLLRLGPVWDFDLSSDNTRNQGGHRVRGWLTAGRDWASQLHRDRSFRRALGNRWKALRAAGFRQAVLREVDRARRVLRPHVDRQFRRWPVLDRLVWPNAVARGSHAAEVRALRAWLSRRMRWIDRATGYVPPGRSST